NNTCRIVTCVLFFFSSRRRHTRSKRDWSSDVCSSDLGSYASSTAGMASAKQIIQSNRTELIETLEELFEDIAIENGLNPNDNPKVSLGKLELSEEKVQHQIIRNLFLDGVISADTYTQAHGHLLEIEQEKI